MALLTPGYWQSTYWPSNYWPEDYWTEYGTPALTIRSSIASPLRRKRKLEFEMPDSEVALILMLRRKRRNA